MASTRNVPLRQNTLTRPIWELIQRLAAGELDIDFGGNIVPSQVVNEWMEILGGVPGQYARWIDLDADQQRRAIDEVRLATGVRTPDWIRAQHLSMTDAFVTFSPDTLHRFANVTALCGPATNRSPLDKVSQRKIVRDASGNRYLVYSRFIDGGVCSGFQRQAVAMRAYDERCAAELGASGFVPPLPSRR